MKEPELIDALSQITGGIKIVKINSSVLVGTRYLPKIEGWGPTIGEAAIDLAKMVVETSRSSEKIRQAVREHEDYQQQLAGRP